jgi:hypothetical protein
MALQETEIILNNNQAEYADLLIFDILTFKGTRIDYSVSRADQVEQGEIYLSFNRFSNVPKITTVANFDDTGVRFCANVDGSRLRLVYTSTDTGVRPVFRYITTKFQL